MSLKVQECNMVCPIGETPNHSVRLSRLDMLVRTPFSHTFFLYIYRSQDNLNNNSSKCFDTAMLKNALSRALVSFYPLAGRLRKNESNGEIEVDCNAKGVLFMEARTPYTLNDFEDEDGDRGGDKNGVIFKPNTKFRNMVNPKWDYSKGISSIPLLMVQLTRFKCGSVCMGVAIHHHIGDGVAYGHFISSWARLSRGLDLLVFPVHERSLIHQLAPCNPPQVKFQHLEFEPRLPPLQPNGLSSGDAANTMEGLFILSKTHINALKIQATSQQLVDQGYTPSTFEAIAGHVWRSACMVRGLASEQNVKLYIPIDARSRLKDQTLPKGYYGNLVFFAACIAKVGDIVSKPLWYAASKIHETLERMQDVEYLKSAVDYLELQPNPMSLLHGADSVTCPNLLINSWARIPFYEADFGWGCPKYFGNGGVRYEGLAFLIPTTLRDGSFTLSINLYKIHMPLFEKYLYDFQSASKI